MAAAIPRIAITTGEPAGVGPELILELARQAWPAELVMLGDARLLASRARALGRQIGIAEFSPAAPASQRQAGTPRGRGPGPAGAGGARPAGPAAMRPG